MEKRWEVERAVLGSQLDPYARLIMLALLAKVNNKTAVIAPEHTPSLTTLQAMTGLGRSSVTEWLGILEAAGWVRRTKPQHKGRRDRTQYALDVGEASVTRPVRPSRIAKAKRSESHSGPEVDRTADQSESESSASARPHSGTSNGATRSHSGPEVDRTAARTRPHSGHASTKSSPTENSSTETPPLLVVESAAPTTTQPRKRQPAAPPTPGTIHAGLVVGAYVEGALGAGKPMPAERLRNQVGKDAKALLAEPGQDPELILKAARQMGAVGWSNLPVQLQRPGAGPFANGRHRAHQNDPTVNYNEDL